ncbi:uncharacterized protein J7T54_007143 [Emericellopsis cladophorae]|uniref:Uncharacterized protein n=1 Tax=Emericellopsis cladophorae TaxID=2686198 RepID=A0A9P9Y8Z7_9HYPO|nr:uncharacterized protein J7T54_007143 [Emericellopsis cladophorae]KAI6785500.1 hypothetical protein J7T54_007143 [Emericellopsis cladophorae]
MLQAVVLHGDTKSPSFARRDSLNLDELVTWHRIPECSNYAMATDKIVNERVDLIFDRPDALPGWRLVVTSAEQSPFLDAHLAVRHTSFDGESRKVFHRTLLDHLNHSLKDDQLSPLFSNGHTLVYPTDGPAFPPPMEEFGDFKIDLGYVLSTAWKELKPACMQKPTATQTSWGPFKPNDYGTERKIVRVDAVNSRKIVDVCRSHKTTITGLLHGIIFASLLWECKSVVESPSFVASSAVNLRRFMPNKPRTMPDVEMDPRKTIVNMLSTVDHEWDEVAVMKLLQLSRPLDEIAEDCRHYEDIVWAVAKSARGDIEKKLDAGLENDVMKLMWLAPDWRSEKKRSCKKARVESWCVTNLGVFDGKRAATESSGKANDSWEIDHAVFTAVVDAARSLFMVSAASVKDGDLCIGVAWQSGLGEYIDKVGDRLTRDMHSWTNHLATGAWEDNWEQRAFA